MTGDGELQEGQNYEALQAAAHEASAISTSIVDHNKLQTDRPSRRSGARRPRGEVAELRLVRRRCDGHDCVDAGARRSRTSASSRDRPKAADRATRSRAGRVVHGAPARARGRTAARIAGTRGRRTTTLQRARAELRGRIGERVCGARPRRLALERCAARRRARESLEGESASEAGAATEARRQDEFVAEAYGEALVALGRAASRDRRARRRSRRRLPHARLRVRYPDRFIENGIAEQDMVSMAARPRAARAAAGRELVRELPRVARERADLQQRERGLEDHLRLPLRGLDSGRAREVAPEPPRHLAARALPN